MTDILQTTFFFPSDTHRNKLGESYSQKCQENGQFWMELFKVKSRLMEPYVGVNIFSVFPISTTLI